MTDFLTKGTDQRKRKQFSIELTKLLTNKAFLFFSFLWEKNRFCRSVSYKTVKISYSNFPCFLLLLVHYDNQSFLKHNKYQQQTKEFTINLNMPNTGNSLSNDT